MNLKVHCFEEKRVDRNSQQKLGQPTLNLLF